MPSNGGDLFRGAAALGKKSCRSLAQAVRLAAFRQRLFMFLDGLPLSC
jgi:hypothetical protein